MPLVIKAVSISFNMFIGIKAGLIDVNVARLTALTPAINYSIILP